MSFDCAALRSGRTSLLQQGIFMPYRVYILLCSDGSYYTGSAADVEKRLWQHQEGVSKEAYTYTRRPVKLVWFSDEVDRYSDALRFERQVKGWSRAKKEALIRNDFDAIHQIVKGERERREKKKVESSALSEVEVLPSSKSFDFAQDEDTQDEK
jgi:predicted GIY-YIG superfamily endonuclease